MRLVYSALAASVLALAVTGAQAGPSAKFSANWASNEVELIALQQINTGEKCVAPDPQNPADQDCFGAEELLATIKVPNKKELLIGVSGVANLVTFTAAKGKNGAGTSTSIAQGVLGLAVKYGPSGSGNICETGDLAAPGRITFASRRQELSVTTDLTITGDITGLLGIDGSVTVALGIDTTAAHHFNFVGVDLDTGEYDVVACFDATGLVSVSGDTDDDIARTRVAIAHRMITIQEVRAVKDTIVDINN